jgi:hypothetical protein
MKKNSFKKLAIAMAFSLSLTLSLPTGLPLASNVATVEAANPTISQKSASLLAGQTLKLKVQNIGKKKVTWSSNNEKAATVKNGLVTATGKGNAIITAKVGNKKLKCKVNVRANSFTFEVFLFTNFVEPGSTLTMPSNAYYKNGKLYCKVDIINKTGHTIKKYGNKKGKPIKKTNVSLYGYTYASLFEDDAPIELATGKVNISFPTDIKNNKTKRFNIEFSAKQIKKKGYDLSKLDFLDIEFLDDIYYY